jgi:hypothetical protein
LIAAQANPQIDSNFCWNRPNPTCSIACSNDNVTRMFLLSYDFVGVRVKYSTAFDKDLLISGDPIRNIAK